MNRKPSTEKDYQERINRILIHVQNHLDEPLYLQELAKIALLSPFHMHRIFHAYTGETLGAYAQRLKLERATHLLEHTNKDISEIALDSGYSTPAAFTKAFKKLFGITPSQLRMNEKLKKPEKKLSKRKNMNLKPEIVTFKPVRVLFLRGLGKYEETPKEVWPAIETYGREKDLIKPTTRRFGISHDDPTITPEEKVRYDACFEVEPNIQADGKFGIQIIPGGKFAVFTHYGDCRTIGNTYDAIYHEWLPTSGYKLCNAPHFDEYLDREEWIQGKRTKAELITKIYIPVE